MNEIFVVSGRLQCNAALLLFLLNPNSCDSQVKVFNIIIRVIKICYFSIIFLISSIYINFWQLGWSCDHPKIYVEPPLSEGC